MTVCVRVKSTRDGLGLKRGSVLYMRVFILCYVCMRAVNHEQHILNISEQKHAH
jgi:hypothetical protein